jgi:hypothetical protein
VQALRPCEGSSPRWVGTPFCPETQDHVHSREVEELSHTLSLESRGRIAGTKLRLLADLRRTSGKLVR